MASARRATPSVGRHESARSRLATLLGGHFPDLTAHQMRRLVDNAVREDVDLDFKETRYGKRDSEKRDLAGDVAALANTLGGALILGLKDEDGTAVGDPGVPLSDAEEQRMHLILASNVAPHIGGVHIRRIERTKGEGFYVIEVPQAQRCRTVRVGNALRYPRRLGTTIHWLSETEVADAYRNRFAAATAQVDRLNDVYVDGMAGLGRNGWSGQDPWVAVALMPDLPGEFLLTHHMPGHLGDALQMRNHPIAADGSMIATHRRSSGWAYVVSPWHRAHARNASDRRSATGSYTRTGAGFGALVVGAPLTDRSAFGGFEIIAPFRFAIPDEDLVINSAQIIDALVEHAVDRSGASGLGVVRAGIEARDDVARPMPYG